MKSLSRTILCRLQERFHKLYGDASDHCMNRLDMTVGRYGIGIDIFGENRFPDERDVYLITYGDMVREPDTPPLRTLKRFMDERTQGTINTVHILPFFPYSSDDGFSVIDYRVVDAELGDWKDIRALSENYEVMADIVINHASRKSLWFREYVMGTAPFSRYFIAVDPKIDLSEVVRPRNLPLLTKTRTRDGTEHVWTTFSSDQVDLNFANPDVLFEFIDILLFYRSQGIRVIRMDAIAFLWKEIGTNCLHHPLTHEVVKLFRDLIEMVSPDMTLLTETNVPHQENVSYFGNGDEAHMVYQFSLPPLLLHALMTGNATYLTQWARALRETPPGCTFLNFTASHDGIGVRPLQGLIPDDELDALITAVRERGGQVSMKRNADGSESPYELNITYLSALSSPEDAMAPSDLSVARFLCTQAITLGLRGIPAVYFNSLVGAVNNQAGVEETGRARTINRGKWAWDDLNAALNDPDGYASRIFRDYLHMLKVRTTHKAFHPFSRQEVFVLCPSVFAFQRTASGSHEAVICLSNVTGGPVQIRAKDRIPALAHHSKWKNLIRGDQRGGKSGTIHLQAYETVWLQVTV